MTKDETRAAIAIPLPQGRERYSVRSRWLADMIADIRKSTYPYNSTVEMRAATELGDALTDTERKNLATLVYNAQGWAREIALESAGFVRATQEILARLEGQKVEAQQAGSLGGVRQVRVKRDAKGTLVMMLPRSRTRCLASYGDNWVKP